MNPDPSRDVMVYQVSMIDALSGDAIGERWTVWLGTESEGSFESEREAVALALHLADEHALPAWRVNENGDTSPLSVFDM
jgi:hypothetical protein